jgi:hypothetical protein
MALFPIVLAYIPPNKMVVPNANFVIFLTSFVRFLYLPHSVPEPFWGEVALTAVYTINRLPSPSTHNKSPFELIYDKLPNYSSLRVFGCACFVSLPSHEKLEPRSRLCCFLGYSISQKGFCCYDLISRRLCISCHVEFWKHQTFSSR